MGYQDYSDISNTDPCILDIYPDLSLVDYGFSYHKDVSFQQDDITWFLMKKS